MISDTEGFAPRRGRGRPRDPQIDGRILASARAVAGDLGMYGASMAAIAEVAGVGKPTIYLRWPDREAVLVAALADLGRPLPEPVGESVAASLTWALEDDHGFLVRGSEASFLRAALFESRAAEPIGRELERSVLAPRLDRLTAIVQRAKDTGNAPGCEDPRTAAVLLTSPLLTAMVLRDRELDCARVVEHVCRALDVTVPVRAAA